MGAMKNGPTLSSKQFNSLFNLNKLIMSIKNYILHNDTDG